MKVLIAPDSFKESLSAKGVADALAKGIKQVAPETELYCLPLADGGEGTREVLSEQLGLVTEELILMGPLGEECLFPYGRRGNLAFLELAELLGLALIPEDKRDPLRLSSYGLGQAILTLIEKGIKEIIIAIGGTAIHDGGIGLAAGLGYRFYDEEGQLLEPMGASLGKIATMRAPVNRPWDMISIQCLTDVTNPMTGPQGATYIFAGQKGLDQASFASVDRDFAHFYQLVNAEVMDQPGAGAGGGLAGGLMTFAGAVLSPGIDRILDLLHFDEMAADVDLVIVGEGKLDAQSLAGKVPIGVARRTPRGIPLLAVCGRLDMDLPFENIEVAYEIMARAQNLDDAMKYAKSYLEEIGKDLAMEVLTK